MPTLDDYPEHAALKEKLAATEKRLASELLYLAEALRILDRRVPREAGEGAWWGVIRDRIARGEFTITCWECEGTGKTLNGEYWQGQACTEACEECSGTGERVHKFAEAP